MCKMQVGMDEKVITEIRKLEQVQEASVTYGAYDLVIKVNFKVMEELDKFLFGKVRRIPGIIETSSMIVAKQVV
jgi:DNA-binding Lrp family transcriptional regulator